MLLQKSIWMDPDMNKYDLNHRVSHHSTMSDAEWEDAYRAAWSAFYTPEHVRTIFAAPRPASSAGPAGGVAKICFNWPLADTA